MDTKTKYYIADMILGLIAVVAIYVTFGMGYMFLDYAIQKGPKDFDEPWLWFGGMVIMPLVIVFYDTILIKVGAIAYGFASKYHTELTGEAWEIPKLRPLRHDFSVMMAFLLFTPYISQQIYGMMEGSSTMVFAVMSIIPAITCVCVMDAFQRFVARYGFRNRERNEKKREEMKRLREALE